MSTLFTPFCDNPACPFHSHPYRHIENATIMLEGADKIVVRDTYDIPVVNATKTQIIGTRTLYFCSICSGAIKASQNAMQLTEEEREKIEEGKKKATNSKNLGVIKGGDNG